MTAADSPNDVTGARRRLRLETDRACLGDLLAACFGARLARCTRELGGYPPRTGSSLVLSKLICGV